MNKSYLALNEYRFLCKELNPLFDYINSTKFSEETIYSASSSLKKIYIELEGALEATPPEETANFIDYFSICDHLFFKNFLSQVTTEEDHAILIHAIGNIGCFLSSRYQKYISTEYCGDISGLNKKRVLFIIKGPFDLAHMSFAKSFLYGHQISHSKSLAPHFFFLDQKPPRGIKLISYDATCLKPSAQFRLLKKIISEASFGTTIWPSVSQNLSLFMGSRFTKQQIFWSARYRNSLFSCIDKYFFGAREKKTIIKYNGADWRYGRFLVAEWVGLSTVNKDTKSLASDDKNWLEFIKRKKSQGYFICATISNQRKIRSADFHDQIVSILKGNPRVYYFYTSRDLNCPLEKCLTENNLSSRFKRISWINTMTPILSSFDLILDSYPVGASHALCYSIMSKTPFISMISAENLQSSLFETIAPIIRSRSIDLLSLGLASSSESYLKLASSLCSKDGNLKLQELLHNQTEIFNLCLSNPVGMYSDFTEHIIA